jgi:hypothetical protein
MIFQQVHEFTVPEPGPAAPKYHAWEGPDAATDWASSTLGALVINQEYAGR